MFVANGQKPRMWMCHHFDRMDYYRSTLRWMVRQFILCRFFHSITHIIHIPNRRRPEDLQIYVGSNDLKGNGTYYNAEKIIVHEEHNMPPSANDIAVIRIQGSIALSDSVKTIEYSNAEVPDGVVAQLTGWGLVVISFFFSYLIFQWKF